MPGGRQKSTVLVVDDEKTNIMAIAGILKDEVDVIVATNGETALKLAAARQPDLVLLDIVMAGLDGYAVCERLKADPVTREIPVVFVTAMDAEQDETRGLGLGAIDYITKPFSAPIVKARVRNHLELKHQRDQLSQLNDELDTFHIRVAAELDMARGTLTMLLPSASALAGLEATHGIAVQAHFEPSSELGGDVWTVHGLDRRRVAIASIDFSGHGVNAALNLFRLHSLLGGNDLDAQEPAEYLRGLNRKLAAVLPSGQYATMFYGIIDLERDTLTFSGAGAPSPVVVDADSEGIVLGDASGVPLGMFDDSTYDSHELPFLTGASLLIYSDALTETKHGQGDRLGEEGLMNIVRRCLAESPRDAFLIHMLDQWGSSAHRPLKDDLTAVFLTRRS
jgi:sigma-B regulation protein RsbU (phosphoserine phosphatase)